MHTYSCAKLCSWRTTHNSQILSRVQSDADKSKFAAAPASGINNNKNRKVGVYFNSRHAKNVFGLVGTEHAKFFRGNDTKGLSGKKLRDSAHDALDFLLVSLRLPRRKLGKPVNTLKHARIRPLAYVAHKTDCHCLEKWPFVFVLQR